MGIWRGRLLAVGVTAAALSACGSSEDELVVAERLPLPPDFEVTISKRAPGVTGNDFINYLVVTGPANATGGQLAKRLAEHLRREGWTIGRLDDTRHRRGEQTAESDDVYAVFDKERCDERLNAAPRAAASAAEDLDRRGTDSICVSLG